MVFRHRTRHKCPDAKIQSGTTTSVCLCFFVMPHLFFCLTTSLFIQRIILEFFQDGVQIDSRGAAAEKETGRLSSEGYTVALETFWDGIQETVWFTLHAEYDQLISFPTSPRPWLSDTFV